MINQRKKNRAWITWVAAAGAVALAGTAQARDTMTKFETNSGQTALVIVDSPSECGDGNRGCKEARRNERLKLKMRLQGNQKCNREDGAQWQLEHVYLGGYNSAGKPSGFGNLGQHPNVADDFDIDLSTGIVRPQSQTNAKIDFINNNRTAYDIWYKVTAVCMSADNNQLGSPISSDPRIRNRGGDS